MGKLNEIQKQMTQSYGDNAFTTTIKDDTVEFDSLKDKFTFKDEVEVPSLKVNGESVSSQVQADWNQNDSEAVDYIKNKPTIPSAQVQSDWNQNDSEAADFIKNKPFGIQNIIYVSGNFNEYGSTGNVYFNPPQPLDCTGGKEFIFIVNDNTYTFTVYGNSTSGSGSISIPEGGGGFAYNNNGISGAPNGETCQLSGLGGNPAIYANASFSMGEQSITKIDKNFESVPNRYFENNYDSGSTTTQIVSCDKYVDTTIWSNQSSLNIKIDVTDLKDGQAQSLKVFSMKSFEQGETGTTSLNIMLYNNGSTVSTFNSVYKNIENLPYDEDTRGRYLLDITIFKFGSNNCRVFCIATPLGFVSNN